MAKDPAVLFYTNDFIAGTYTMTDAQVGKYIRLLCLQHQKYELSKDDMLKICKTYDKVIFDKFIEKEGFYHNQRMRDEAIKRAKYAESRRANRLKKEKSYVPHMENENVIENRNRVIKNNDYKKALKEAEEKIKTEGKYSGTNDA